MSRTINATAAASVAAILLAMVSITAGASIAKLLFLSLSPENVTVLRLTVSAIILFVGLRAWKVRLKTESALVTLAYGATVAGMNLFFYLAIQKIPVAVALAIELIGPLCVSAYYSRSRYDHLWVCVAAIGVYSLVPASPLANTSDALGVTYAAEAAVFWGAYIILGKRAGKHFGTKTPALGLVVASMLVMPFGDLSLKSISFSFDLMVLIVIVALLSSAIPLVLEMFALRNLPTKTYGVLTSGEPAIGAIVSFIVLGEQLDPLQCFGIGAIVAASIGIITTPASHRLKIHS